MSYYIRNEEKNGIEIYFDKIPSEAVRGALKSEGWRWNGYKKCWYHYYSEAHLQLAKIICLKDDYDRSIPRFIESKTETQQSPKNTSYYKYDYNQLPENKRREIDFNEDVKNRIKSRIDTFPEVSPTQKNNVLFKHQRAGCLLADHYDKFAFFYDTGTGKTVMALDIINSKYQKYGARFLIIAPKAIIQTAWLDDARKYYPGVRILPMTKGFDDYKRKRLLEQWLEPEKAEYANVWTSRQDNALDFLAMMTGNLDDMEKDKNSKSLEDMAQHYIINPEMFIRNPESYIEKLGIDGLVVDESAIMKNHESITSKTILATADKMKYVYLLSGKPAPNNELEYYSQMKAVDPDTFNMSYSSFEQDFNTYGFRKNIRLDITAKETLSKLISARSLVISKDDCLDLPDTVEIVHQFELPEEIMKEYDRLYSNCLAVIKGMDRTARFYTTASKLAVLMKLRQLASGFFIINDKEGNRSEGEIVPVHERKIEELESILDEIGDEQVIIWCQFKYEIQRIEKLLQARGTVVTAYGGTKDVNRSIIDFKEGRAQYIIAHPKTLKYGVTFTNCRYAVYYSFSYSAEDYDQSHDRIYRLGQTKKCTFIFLQAEKTIDELMYQKVMYKLSNAEFFECLIKDASIHGIDYDRLKECDDDDYSEVVDDLVVEAQNLDETPNNASRKGIMTAWGVVTSDSYGDFWISEKSEADKEIDELIELTCLAYDDLTKLRQILTKIIIKSLPEREAKSVIFRHCLDLKYKKERSWNEVGRLVKYSGTMTHEFYSRGIRWLRRDYHEFFEYLADIYIKDQNVTQTDKMHDIIFDCLTPPDPTRDEEAELQVPPSYEKYRNINECEVVTIKCALADKSMARVNCSLIKSYVERGTLCMIFKFDGASNNQDVEIVIDELTIIYNGSILNSDLNPKTNSEAKAIVFRTLRFDKLPFELSEHEQIDIYFRMNLIGTSIIKDFYHFSSKIGTKGDLALETIYPYGRPLKTIDISELGLTFKTEIILRNWRYRYRISNLESLSKLSYGELKKMHHMTNDAIEEIREKLSEYGLELKGYKSAQREKARKKLLKEQEREHRRILNEQAFSDCLSDGSNVRLLRVVTEAIIFEITPYMLNLTEYISVKSIGGNTVNLTKTIALSEKNKDPLSFRIDLSEELLRDRSIGDIVEIEYEVHIKEYDYERTFVETLKLESVYGHLSSDYSTEWDKFYEKQQFIKIRHLASFVHNNELCLLFHIENNWISYADVSFDYLTVDNTRLKLTTSEQSVDGNGERLFYVLVDNQNYKEIEGSGIVRLQIGSYEEDIPIDLSCIYDENYKMSYRDVESLNYQSLSLNEAMYTTDGNLVLNRVTVNKDETNMEFFYSSDLRTANGRLILYVNGDVVSDTEFKYYKNTKHKILSTIKREKLEFLGVRYNRNNAITIRFIQLDYLGRYKKHRDFKKIINITDLMLKSRK